MAEHLVTFVHLSDTHIHADPTYTGELVDFSSRGPVQRLIDAVNALPMPINFILHTGDIAHNPETPEHYKAAVDMLKQLRYPVHYIPGNHDDVETMQSAFLGCPDYAISRHCDYQFTVNGVQFVMLDSHAPAPTEQDPYAASGHLAPEQLAWLAQICSADDARPLVVAMHHHAIPLEAPWLDRIVLKNGLQLHEILLSARHRLRGVFYGHIHESVVTVRDGISYYAALSGWFQTRTWYAQEMPARDLMREPGFNLVTLTKEDTFVRHYRVPLLP